MMQTKDVWKDYQSYDRSFSFPEVLEHEKYPEEVHAYAAKTIANRLDKDEQTLDQALKQGGVEWPLWQEAIRKVLSSLIIENKVFELIEYKDVLIEMKSRIFNLLILLKCKRDQYKEITKCKARLVMDGSRAKVGEDVLDTYAPVIDWLTVQ
jgi:hypothetical protein